MNWMIDIHAHVLYGLDDGAQSPHDMHAMLRAADVDGVAHLFATPHVAPGISPFREQEYWQRLAEARRFLADNGLSLRLHAGAEVLYTPAARRFLIEGRVPTLGGTSYLLVEFVPDIEYNELLDACSLMVQSGYRPILAHIERYRCLLHGHARQLKSRFNVLYQVNCSAVLGGRGALAGWSLHRWLAGGLVDILATDAHDTVRRPTRMAEAYCRVKRQFGAEYADQITGGRLFPAFEGLFSSENGDT